MSNKINKLKVLHVISGLNDGGAEGVLYRLCLSDMNAVHTVVSLTSPGKYADLLMEGNIRVHCLNMSKEPASLLKLFYLGKIIKEAEPDIVQTWMYHADLIGGLIAKLVFRGNVFWNIRHSDFDRKKSGLAISLVVKLCAFFSHFIPHKIIVCAANAEQAHVKIKYDSKKFCRIGNGYDFEKICPNLLARRKFRDQLGLSDSDRIITMVARYNVQKDHDCLLRAVSLIRKELCFKNAKLVLVGNGVESKNTELVGLINKYELDKHVILLGQSTDIPSVMNGSDMHVLSSAFGEGFPNVVAEAMACAVPCVSTNVGDASYIIGETGWIVEPRKAKDLSQAIIAALHELDDGASWGRRKIACRQRVVSKFSLSSMIGNYHSVWDVA